MLAQYPKECLLETNQTPTRVGDSPKKLAIGDKTKPLGFQRVGPDSGQPSVTWLGHLILPFRTWKCQFQNVLLYPKE
jgi:hypothetical protein